MRQTRNSGSGINAMKSWLSLSFLLILSAVHCYGQSQKKDGLVLTGTIIGVHAIAECSGTEGRILVAVEVSMQFRNDSDRQLIILKPNSGWPSIFGGEVGRTRVNFLKNLSSVSDKEYERIQVEDIRTDNCRSASNTYYRNYDPVASFIKLIDVASPPSEQCVVIGPRGYHEFREVLTLDAGFEVDVKVGKSLKEARIRSEYPAFQVQYHLSLKGNAKGEGLFRTLQTRWKSYGDFVLDSSGDFTVTSEPIINRTSE